MPRIRYGGRLGDLMPATRFEIRLRRPLANGEAFGERGSYEELKGQLDFAIDPLYPANQRITDVALAPRNAAGRVEFAADVSVLLPIDRRRANGRLVLDVVNRGNLVAVPNFNRATRPVFGPGSDPDPAIDVGDGFLMRQGFIVASCGWQDDLPRLPGLLGLDVPEALGPQGQRVTGRIYTQMQASRDVPDFLLSDRGHVPHPAADLDERDAVLIVRDQPDADPETIPRGRWRFARVVDGRVVPDANYVHMDGGFTNGRLYQIVYTAHVAPLHGRGMAALRDCVSCLKYGGAGEGQPAPGVIQHAYAYGRSQTGRLLRTMIWEDLLLDEQGREALDGVIGNVAGGMRGEFNDRFGQNSKDRTFMMRHLFPFTDLPEADPMTDGRGALHHRLDARRSRLKVMYTNTSSEYHRGDASLIHTDPDGKSDVPHGDNVRIYHFSGTEHGLGVWPPTDAQPAAADPTGTLDRSQSVRNVINYAPLLRACLINLDRWVRDGVAPPPSRHPRLDDGTAVPPQALASVFDRIPGAHYPRHHAMPRRLDFTTLPPRTSAGWGSRVAAVDDDGNERGGIALPELAVPLAAFTGWNLRHPEIGGAEQRLAFAGSTLPFARTRRDREKSGDPRPSVQERYPSRDEYLVRVRAAAVALVTQRYLLEDDVRVCLETAAKLWDWLAVV